MSNAQTARSSAIKMLTRRGWATTDNKNFVNGEYTLAKEPGNKFSKWILTHNGSEVVRNGELNLIIGLQMGHQMALGLKSTAKKAVKAVVAAVTPEPAPAKAAKAPKAPKAPKAAPAPVPAPTPAPAAKVAKTAKATPTATATAKVVKKGKGK